MKSLLAVSLAVLVALVGALPADAQCPTVYRGRAVVAAPAYSFHGVGYAKTYVPFALPVAVLPHSYYAVNDDKEIIKELLRQLGTEQQFRLQGGAAGQPAASPKGQQQRATTADVRQVIAAKCAACHGGGLGTGGNINLTNPDAVDRPTRLKCWKAVGLNAAGKDRPSMPKDADPLAQEEIDAFEAWFLEANAPPGSPKK